MKRNRPCDPLVTVVGGGLAGCEAAWQLARRGVRVRLYEMRPHTPTPAHVSDRLAELVCSNSLGGKRPYAPAALLKAEMRRLGSLLLEVAEAHAVEAGAALAVDREAFSAAVTRRILDHPAIEVVRERVDTIPEGPTIIATGPLTDSRLAEALSAWLGDQPLAFFDAVAPVVMADSIDWNHAFWGSREGDAGYVNCPLTREEYEAFYEALMHAEQHPLHPFEQVSYFEGCLPIEELARRGPMTPLFGPMKPVGLIDPRTGRRPYAVVQLRRDNLAGSLFSLVGFQTNLRWGEQKRVFAHIPALAHAEYARYGVMHRNTFLKSPLHLNPDLSSKRRPDLWIAGQLIGVEGYVESAAAGMLAGINAARRVLGRSPWVPPPESMWGALMHYVTHAEVAHFQPMNANYGLLPLTAEAARAHDKKERRRLLWERALAALEASLEAHGEVLHDAHA